MSSNSNSGLVLSIWYLLARLSQHIKMCRIPPNLPEVARLDESDVLKLALARIKDFSCSHGPLEIRLQLLLELLGPYATSEKQ